MNFEHYLVSLPGLFWICIIVPSILALIGVAIARKLVNKERRQQQHEMAKALLGPIATIFGILAAFIVATTWTEYSTTQNNLNEESDVLSGLYLNAEAFSPEFSNEAHTLYRLYRDAILEHEWKIVNKGVDNLVGDDLLIKIAHLYMNYHPRDGKEQAYFEWSINKLTRIKNLRQQRIDDSSSGLLPLLWVLFLIGGGALVIVSFFMVSSTGKTHGAVTILIALIIGMMIFAVMSLDFPFVGCARMNATPFKLIPMEKSCARSAE